MPSRVSLGVMAVSFLISQLLLLLRTRFPGWPLHPLGLALANSVGGVGDVVAGVFVASVAKGVILRYSQREGYERAVPFFLGLILGDFVMGVGWRILGILLDTPTYVFFL